MGVKNFLGSPTFLFLLSFLAPFSSGKYVIRLRVDAQCPTPGYFRDETDCRKFYRCAEHPTAVLGQKYITRSEFNCPPGTIFDEALSNCNHVMFVHNIPPGCDVSGAIVPHGDGSGDSGLLSAAADVPLTSTVAPLTTPTPPTTVSPSEIHNGEQPQFPLIPPESIQNIPAIPGGGDQQQPMLPSIQQPMLPSIGVPMIPGGGGDQQQQQPMFPSINFPMLPGGGSDQQNPMFPSINFPMLPGGGGDQQNPMFPSINFPKLPEGDGGQFQPPMLPSINIPMLPAEGDKKFKPIFSPINLPTKPGQQLPMFPSINIPSLPESQQPMIPSIPSLPSESQHQQSLLNLQLPNKDQDQQHQQTLAPSLPSFNLPPVPGSPFLPQLTFPSSLNLQEISNQNNQQPASSSEQNFASSPVAAITAPGNGQSENKPPVGGWVTPQKFPNQQHPVVTPTQQGDSGWVVPDNFPTFYSAFSRGSPIFLSSFASNPSSLILI